MSASQLTTSEDLDETGKEKGGKDLKGKTAFNGEDSVVG